MKKLSKSAIFAISSLVTLSAGLSACGSAIKAPEVPAAVAVPAGNKPAMSLNGSGLLTYECRAKAGAADTFEWAFAGPDAKLTDQGGATVGKYYGGPTWEHSDGSKVTGKQLAVSPAAPGNIPLQLVQANPATGEGKFSGVTYIQRLNTKGGVAPSDLCNSTTAGTKKMVNYSADYVFYKK